MENALADRLAALPERERMMMRLRLGVADGRQWDLREIAREFDTTRNEVRMIEAKFFSD